MFDGITVGAVVVAASPALVLAAVVAERVHLRRRTGDFRLGELFVAATMLCGSVAVGTVVGPLLADLWSAVARLAPAMVRDGLARHPVIECSVAFVAWDLAGYAYHRIGHETAPGWAAHRPHHTGAHYDLSLAWRQTWIPWAALITFPLVALTGVSFEIAVVCAALSNCWQALVHTVVPVRLPRRLGSILMTPTTHRWHHESGRPVNLGPVLTCWDRLAGTFEIAPEPATSDRLPRPVVSRNPVSLEFRGWWDLVRTAGICTRGPVRTGLSTTHSGDTRGLRHACRSRSRPRTARG